MGTSAWRADPLPRLVARRTQYVAYLLGGGAGDRDGELAEGETAIVDGNLPR